MCTLAPRAALGFGATAGECQLLKRPQCAVAVPSTACGRMARETSARGGGAGETSAPARKRARIGFDDKSKVPAPALRVLGERMEAELDAVLGLLKKAELLSRSGVKRAAVPAGKEAPFPTAEPRPEEDLGNATKKRKMSPSKPTPVAAQKNGVPRDQRSTPPMRKAPMNFLLAEAEQARARRRREEIAREREKFRQELLEVERAALPDETIYPEDLEELGIAGFEYAVTPTRKQARRGHG
ncbi:hypothetical protein ACP70R_039971 [Stipagrostis hirtigluma subsp. patula]